MAKRISGYENITGIKRIESDWVDATTTHRPLLTQVGRTSRMKLILKGGVK